MKKLTILIILSLFTSTAFAGFGDTWAFGPWKTGENLVDPGTDSIPFWDDSAGVMAWGGASVAPDFYYVVDDGGIGIGPALERIVFDADGDDIELLGGDVFISATTGTPEELLHVSATSPVVLVKSTILAGTATLEIVGGGNNTTSSRLKMGDRADTDVGMIQYQHGSGADDDQMEFRTFGSVGLILTKNHDLAVKGDIYDLTDTDVIYPGKCVIKTIGINGSGTDFEFAANANTAEQNIDLGAILPAGCVVVSVVLECDVTFSDGAPQSLATDVGIASGSAELLASDPTDFDGNTNVTAAAASPVLAHSTAARNVWVNSTPGVNWLTLTGGELSIIIRYDDLGAVRAQKGL